MNLTSKTAKVELLLHPREILTLNDSQHRLAVECKEGLIWVTCAGDSRDHMLFSGRRYVAETRGSLVIEAIDDACVDIEEPA